MHIRMYVFDNVICMHAIHVHVLVHKKSRFVRHAHACIHARILTETCSDFYTHAERGRRSHNQYLQFLQSFRHDGMEGWIPRISPYTQ